MPAPSPEAAFSAAIRRDRFLCPCPARRAPAPPGLVTFLSFLLFGSIPLWGYVVFRAFDYNDRNGTFVIACCIAGFTMFLLGAVKAKVTKQNPLSSGMLMLLNGGVAAGCAYLAGFLLEKVLNIEGAAV